MRSLLSFEILLVILNKLFLFVTTRLSIGDFSSCIPEEYRGVRREIWKGLNGGWYLKHLTSDKRFPDSPTTVQTLRRLTPPRNDDNYYGQRLQAYFIAPASGNYTFYATCDSECVFYLSFDEKPGNKKELIRIDQEHRTGYEQWHRYLLQRSCLQKLEKGKLYYIEALHSNYVDNDHVRIQVVFPGSSIARSLDAEHLFLYSPGSSAQTTCVLLRRCGVSCGGGLGTRIMTRQKLMTGACVKHIGSYKETPRLQVEGYNITTSTAVIAWKPLQRNESGVIDFSGYRVSLKSNRDRTRIKLVNTSITSLLFEELRTHTNYCVTVEPLTALTGADTDDCYHLITEDGTPDLPPENITAVSRGPMLIVVKWKPVPERHRNGIILGYKLTLKFLSAVGHSQQPRDDETARWLRLVTVLGPNVLLAGLRDVKPFTWYCLKMLAFTRKGDGAESSCVFTMTEEHVPSLAPVNVTATPLNSTSFSVTWQPVSPDHVHGIVLGYKVLLEDMADGLLVSSETVTVNQTHIVLNGTKEASALCVRVVAFTRKGDGRASSCIEAWTWSEETLFPKMTATNHGSPAGITLTWDKPRDKVLHQLTHYHVTYEAVCEAGKPVVNSSSFSVNVSAESREVSLGGLSTYTTYKIKVEPVTLDGKVQNNKIIFAATCRCPYLMLASWIPSPPYVIKHNSSSTPRGIIPEVLAHMLQGSCGTCFSYSTWNISYNINTTQSITEPDDRAKVDFRFPVRSAVGRTIYRGFYSYVPLITVPGVAVMTRKKTPSAYARDLGNSVLGCWPIFAISFVMAILVGVVIWFAESESNSKQFFKHFHKGIVEGVWWSFVTMTTVGYGDKYPKTIVGRTLAILWFLTGIVLSSLLVSSLTSSMSVRILDKHLNVARGKKVGSLAQFPEYDILIRYLSSEAGGNTFPSLEKLVDALKQGEVDGILVDLYTAHYRSDLFNASWIEISQILPFEFTSGVVISGNAAKLERHFREYVASKATVVTTILQKTNQQNDKVTTQSSVETDQMPLLDPSTPVYHVTLSILFSLLCLAVTVGLVYHLWYKKNQKRRYNIQAIRIKERKEYMKARQELKDMVEEFYQRFSLTYKQMRLKHRRQLERLKRTETINGKGPANQPNGDWV